MSIATEAKHNYALYAEFQETELGRAMRTNSADMTEKCPAWATLSPPALGLLELTI